MSYLLDTCILSKLRKINKNPDLQLEKWISKQSDESFFISILTLGEIQLGISKIDTKKESEKHKKIILEHWFFEEVIPFFEQRTLAIDSAIALTWGRIVGEKKKQGINIPTNDGLIAATALVHNLTLVTENIKDFTETGVRLFNPWL